MAAVFMAPVAARPQEPQAVGPDHDALRALKAVYEKAVNEDKVELLEPHLLPEFTGVMVTGEPVAGMKDLRAYWAKIKDLMGAGGRYTVALKPEVSTILGDVALGRGTTDDKVVTGSGKEYVFTTSWTALLRKVDGQWKLLRIQGSMDPIGNPFVLSAVRWMGLSAAAAAGLGGLVVGYILRLLTSRRAAKP